MVLPAVFAQQPDPKELVRQSVLNYEKSWRARMRWSYTQTDVSCGDNTKQVDVSLVVPLDGTPYERPIEKNGHALSSEEQRREDEKYKKELESRQSESPEARKARIDKYEKERAFLLEIPAAYDFKLVGEEVVSGRPAWVVRMTPRAAFEPTMIHAGMMKHIAGKLWIDKQDLQWAKAEADVIDSVNIGLILARIAPGAHITLNFTRMSDKFWVPTNLAIQGEARILLVHNKNLDERITFSNYRFAGGGAESQVALR